MTGLLPALAGANLIYGLGMLESGVTFDFGQLVMDNEFARMIRHAVGGIRVDDESLAVEDIAAVGPVTDFKAEVTLDGEPVLKVGKLNVCKVKVGS